MPRKYTRNSRKSVEIEVENCYITVIEGPNGEKIFIDKLLRDHLEQYNWCVQQHFDRYGRPVKPYALRRVDRKLKYMHRLVWEHMNGPIPPTLEIDHINGNTLDNRIENLRLVTHKENQNNQKIHRKTP